MIDSIGQSNNDKRFDTNPDGFICGLLYNNQGLKILQYDKSFKKRLKVSK